MAGSQDFSDLGGIPVNAKPPAGAADFADLGGVNVEPPKQPDMLDVKAAFKNGISEARAPKTEGGDVKSQNEARTYLDDLEAGWQNSTTALGITRQSLPDKVMPEHADRLARILYMGGQFAGDVPAMVAGFLGGGVAGATAGGLAMGVAGSVVPVAGTLAGTAAGVAMGGALGASAGAFALPAGLRQALVDHYKKGDIQSREDFMDRASAVLHETIKAGTLGMVTGAVGMGAKAMIPLTASPLTRMGVTTAAEAAALTASSAAIEQRLPQPGEFVDNALFMAALHGVTSAATSPAMKNVTSKLFNIYAKTGLNPHEVSQMAAEDPVLRQEVMSSDDDIPQSLQKASDPKAPKEPQVEINPHPELTKKIDGISSATEKEEVGKMYVKGEVSKLIGEQPEAEGEKLLSPEKLYYNILDKNDALKNMTKSLMGEEALGTKDDPYGLIRAFGSTKRKADYMLDYGPRLFKSPLEKTGTPSLTDTWEKVEDKTEYTDFLIAKQALDMNEKGLKSGVDLEQAKATVDELQGKYGKIQQAEVRFGNDGLRYLRDSGVISKDTYDTLVNKWPNHISMRRIMDVEDQKSGGKGGGVTPFNPLKAFSEEGSTRQIENPLESRVKDFHQAIEMAERNRVSAAVTDMIDKAIKDGDTTWGNKMKTPMEAIDIKPEEISKLLVKQGVSTADADAIAEAATIFRKYAQPLEDGQIASYKDGKRQVYENVPKGVVDAMRNMDAQQLNMLTKALAGPSKALRVGMLNSPMFAARHFFRQEALDVPMSKDLVLPLQHTIMGLTGMVGDDFGNWVMHGGGSDSIAAIDNDYIKSKIFETNEATGFSDKQFNKVTNGVQFIKHGIELTDEARALGRYKTGLKRTGDPWQAAFDARDTAIDVNRTGAAMKTYAALDPFQNIRIQGLDLIARRIKEDPTTVIPKLIATITIPSVTLWYLNHDKDWYQQLTPQDRDMNWHFPLGDPDNGGHVIRVPKPFEPGVVFGSLPERLLEQWKGEDPHAFENFGKTVKDSMMPGYIPTFAQPMFEQWANKSLLTDSPLIPHHLEGINPEYQSKNYTSDVAKMVASAVRMLPLDLAQKPGSFGSPIIVDNYLRNWTGGVGQLLISATDAALEKSGMADKIGVDYNHAPPEKVWADNPFLRSFVIRYPSTNTRAVGEFFDRAQNFTIQQATLQNRQQAFDINGVQKQMGAMVDDGTVLKLTGIKKAISEQMSLIDKITTLPGDPHEKRQNIDRLAVGVNAVAAEGNKIMDQIEEMVKEHKRAAGQ